MKSLIWFRSDLRTDDNPALTEAIRRADSGTVGIFILTPEQWREHDWGGPKVDFLLRNLESLSRTLAKLGIPLLVRESPRFDGVAQLLDEVRQEFSCEAFVHNGKGAFLNINQYLHLGYTQMTGGPELEAATGVRAHVMARFDERAIDPGEPMHKLWQRFAPVYFHHRAAYEGAIKTIGTLGWPL